MAQMKKLEELFELKCSADKLFEMLVTKQADLPNVCSDVVSNKAIQHDNWTSVGSIREWSCVIGGKSQHFIEKIEAIDEGNKTIHRSMSGELLKNHYKKLESKVQIIPKGNECCIVKLSFEYEKANEDAPEPHHVMELGISTFKDVGSHLACAN